MRKVSKTDPEPERSIFNKVFKKLKSLFIKTKSEKYHTDNIKFDNKTLEKLQNFTTKTVEDVMIPRSDIIAVDINSTLKELNDYIIHYAHARTPVYKDNLDDIVGFIHIKDLFEIVAYSKKFDINSLLRKHIVSPPSMKLVDLLKLMQNNRTHMAVVVDEYGGTDGLVTIEDIIEEIVGRIDDEHDEICNEGDYKLIKPGLLISNARVEIETLEQELKIDFACDNDEIDTVGGLIIAKVGRIPKRGNVINITDDIVVEILDSTDRIIKKVKITYPNK